MSTLSRFSLFKRNNGVYYVGYYQGGKRVWKSTGARLKTDAIRTLTNFSTLLQEQQIPATLSRFISEFIPYATGNYSKTTVDFYRLALARLKEMSGDCLLSSLTMQHLDQYKVKRIADRVSGVTVNRELQALRAALTTAVRWKHISSNPFSRMQQVALPERTPSYFSKADMKTLMSAIQEPWLKEVILFGVLTGMRRGEILNLRWQDIDLTRKTILIQTSPTFRTKQGKRRVIPLNDLLIGLLRARATHSQSDYVFTLKNARIRDDFATKRLKNYIRDCGLDERLHFHSLRHTFASWLVQNSVSIYEVQKLLGHSNIAVTQVYSHLQPEQLHSTVNRISLPLN